MSSNSLNFTALLYEYYLKYKIQHGTSSLTAWSTNQISRKLVHWLQGTAGGLQQIYFDEALNNGILYSFKSDFLP